LEVPLDLINVNMMQLRLPDNAKKIVMWSYRDVYVQIQTKSEFIGRIEISKRAK
jgi:hypothetical protein